MTYNLSEKLLKNLREQLGLTKACDNTTLIPHLYQPRAHPRFPLKVKVRKWPNKPGDISF